MSTLALSMSYLFDIFSSLVERHQRLRKYDKGECSRPVACWRHSKIAGLKYPSCRRHQELSVGLIYQDLLADAYTRYVMLGSYSYYSVL